MAELQLSRLPTDEFQLTRAHVGDAVLFGACITSTSGIYAAELQAIARALAIFPASYTVHVHADSRGALAGIQAYERECNARQRLRMAARPLLQLIAHLLSIRRKAGGSAHWHHVKAHKKNSDIDSVGNRRKPLAHAPAQVSRSHCSYASCPSRTANITWLCIKNLQLVTAAC